MLATLCLGPPAGWWYRALGWALASWVTALALTLAGSVAHALTQAQASAAIVFWYFGGYIGVYAAAALAPLVPALLGWAYFGPVLGGLERRWAGVGLGSAALALVGAAVIGPWFRDAVPAWAVWLLVWAWVLGPRLAVPGLRPGAFGQPVSNRGDCGSWPDLLT